MPKIKNIFTKARMNKDLDERLVPGGEYREAQNVSIATSEDSDVGAIENIRGNKKLTTQEIKDLGNAFDVTTIGSYVDVSNDRIFWFTTSCTSTTPNADIHTMQRAKENSNKHRMKVVMKEGNNAEEVLASGLYLNFTKTHPITGVNTIGNYLYFTDNYNSPRVIDVDLARNNTTYYVDAQEEKISVAKVAPYLAPMLNKPNTIDAAASIEGGGTGYSVANDLATTGGTGTGLKVNVTTVNSGVITAITISEDDIGYGYSIDDVLTITGGGNNATVKITAYPNVADGQTLITSNPNALIGVKSDYMQERFIRFAYRYKYKDGTYSIMSPFTQPVFKPLNAGILKFSPDTAVNATTNEPKVNISSQDVVERGIVPLMQNAYDKVIMRIPLPTIDTDFVFTEHQTTSNKVTTTYENDKGLRIKDIEILLKESNGISVKLVDTINVDAAKNESTSPFGIYTVTPKPGQTHHKQFIEYTYKAKEPFKVLPEKQLIRVSDDVPVRAKAQEVVGNRIVYGNITLGYDVPNDEAGNKGISFFLSSDNKGNVEKGVSSGHFYFNTQSHRFHTVKQRRTYQAGIVLMDVFGRMSPVIPSTYKSDDLSDTHTVVAETDSYAANTDGSWENTFKTYGKALNIDFQDSRIVPTSNTHQYEDNPNGWFAWKVVVKQTEQEYYNVYTQHPMNNWSVTKGKTVTDNPNNHADDQDQVVAGLFDTSSRSRSWFSLTGDNINKVPRSIIDIDEFKDGVAGSEVQLYPKVVQINVGTQSGNVGNRLFDSKMGIDGQEYIDVMTIGDAKSQGLFSISNAKNGPYADGAFIPRSLPDRERVYDFLQDAEKNPTVAEIPNLDNEIVNVTGEFTQASDVVSSTDDSNNDRPFGYPKAKDKGLTVFETKPFQSNLDIYYETATCGTVTDLNLQCEAASSGPTNVRITATAEKEAYAAAITASFPESFDYTNNNKLEKQIGELTATVDDPTSQGYTMSNFQLMAVTNNDDTDGADLGKFEIDEEDDITVVRRSAKHTSAANANGINLTLNNNPGVIIARFKNSELAALSTGGSVAMTSIPSDGAGFYKIWFYDNSGTNITDQRQCVIQVDANNAILAITNEQAGPGGGAQIDPRFMLKLGHQFGFSNNGSDDYSILVRATQSNNASSLQTFTVSVANSNPVGTNANGFIDNQSTYGSGGKGYQVGTITAVNGSANAALNKTGLTAAISGGTNSSMFNIQAGMADGTFTIRTNNTFTYSGFFGNDNISGRAISIVFTDIGGLTSPTGVAATQFTIFPRTSTPIDGHYLAGALNDVCTIKYNQPAVTYYIKSSIGGGGGAAPTQSGGVNAGNIIHTDKLLNNPVAAGTFTVSGINPRHAVSGTGVVSASTFNCPIA